MRHKSGEEFRFSIEHAQKQRLNNLESISPEEMRGMTVPEMERIIKILTARCEELKKETGQEETYTANEENLEKQKDLERLTAEEEIDKIKNNRKREELMIKQDANPQATLLRRQDDAKRQEQIKRLEVSYGKEQAQKLNQGIEKSEKFGSASALERAYRNSLRANY